MPKQRDILFCLLALVISLAGLGQTNTTDSLQALLTTARDTNRVNILNKLSSSYWFSDPQKTFVYAREASELAQKINFKKGIASAYNNTGVGYYQQNNYDQALQWYNKALAVHRETGNYRGEGYLLTNMGLIYTISFS